MGARISPSHFVIVAFIILTAMSGVRGFAQEKTVTGQENQLITQPTAVQVVRNFQMTALPTTTPWGFFFGRNVLQMALSQPDCIGLRVYLGRQSGGGVALVIVGVDSRNDDIVDGLLIDTGFPCPPFCDSTRTLGHRTGP